MALSDADLFADVIAHAKEYGFIFPSSDLYDGLSAVYDYGPYGSELKKNIRDYWWKSMTQSYKQYQHKTIQIVGIDAAIFMHPITWKASGHVDHFSDPMIDNRDSKKRYRVDHLIESKLEDLEQQKKSATVHVQEIDKQINDITTILEKCLATDDFVGLETLIKDYQIVCPISKTANWTPIRQFNLMFSTQLGSVTDEASTIYLRPETAQGIFVNFLNVQKTARMQIPFGIAQIGKAFRNEIVARQFIFRMREFEQMEMQFFIRPGDQKEWFEYWKEERLNWFYSIGIPENKLKFHPHVKLAHYADAAVDIEYQFPFGFKEVEGIHSRTDFDLSQHQQYSKKKIQYFDAELNKSYTPFVIETSIGLDRLCLLLLCNSIVRETITKDDGSVDSRVVLKFPPALAPIKLAILPLTKKDGLPEIAHKILKDCTPHFRCFYEEKDTIGKRYRRQDAIGTPFCVTVDYQSKEDSTVTIRYRDDMRQERIPINELVEKVKKAILIN